MTGTGFRVTVEDLKTGEKSAMVVSEGDYMLIPFTPCYLHYTQRQANGTVQITLKDHRPTGKPKVVDVDSCDAESERLRAELVPLLDLPRQITKLRGLTRAIVADLAERAVEWDNAFGTGEGAPGPQFRAIVDEHLPGLRQLIVASADAAVASPDSVGQPGNSSAT